MGARVAGDILKSTASLEGIIKPETPEPLPQKRDREAGRDALRHIMTDMVGVIRDKWTLAAALRDIAEIAQNADKVDSRLADMALVASLITVSALRRTESRGAHCRSDYPKALKTWEKRSFVTLKEIDMLMPSLIVLSFRRKPESVALEDSGFRRNDREEERVE
jgi:L-aspartate oxidase